MRNFTMNIVEDINIYYDYNFPSNVIKDIYEEFVKDKYVRQQDLMDEFEWYADNLN